MSHRWKYPLNAFQTEAEPVLCLKCGARFWYEERPRKNRDNVSRNVYGITRTVRIMALKDGQRLEDPKPVPPCTGRAR